MKIMLLGSSGQLGWELRRSLAPLGVITALGRAGSGSLQGDLAKLDELARTVRSLKPGIIVNAAAYTAVDQAEAHAQTAEIVNAAAPEVLAYEARAIGAWLVHYSTDYVFDGEKNEPYVEKDATCPINAYGASKLAGEQAIVASGCRHLILRTSWVYGPRGRNFYLTMLRLAKERPELRVVDDQVGAPTSSLEIARATATLLAKGSQGLYHMTAAGETTWCGFARAILERAGSATPVVAIRAAEYPTPAQRPRNSRLDCSRLRTVTGVAPAAWEQGLAEVMER